MTNLTNIARKMHTFAYFSEGSDRPAGHNRRIRHRLTQEGHREIVKTLHGHEVAGLVWIPEGYKLWLNNCGWRTPTTGKAIKEFLVYAGISPFLGASQQHVAALFDGGWEHLQYDHSVSIPLDNYMRPIMHYSDFEIKGTTVHYKVWHALPAARELIGEYAVHRDVPDGVKALTRGWVEVGDHKQLRKILRAKKPETREARLMALVLTGEAVIHAW